MQLWGRLTGDDDVGGKAKEQEGQVCDGTPPSADDLEVAGISVVKE
jgi:hypothetical protein